MTKPMITFMGGGHMAASIAQGLLRADYPAQSIRIIDRHEEKLDAFRAFGMKTASKPDESIRDSDVLIMAVKPQHIMQALETIKPLIADNQELLLISVAAGRSISIIEEKWGEGLPIVRSMPNTPSVIQHGATALFANQFVNDKHRDWAESIMRAVGIIVWVNEEEHMDIVTSLSGSGPAYVFYLLESMEQAAKEFGLPAEQARLLALQTGYGASALAWQSDLQLSELREQVTLAGGTTAAALNIMNDNNFKETVKQAMAAAVTRAKELAKIDE